MRELAIKYGSILGLIKVILSLLGQITGLVEIGDRGGTSTAAWALVLIVSYVVIHIANKDFKENLNEGFLGVGQAVKLGLGVALVGGIIGGLYYIVNVTLIDPEIPERIVEGAIEQMENQGQTEEQMEIGLKITRFMIGPLGGALISIIFSGFSGLIFGLLTGIIQKTERPVA